MAVSVSPAPVPQDVARAIVLPESYARIDEVVHPACQWLRENLPVGLAEVEGYDPVWMITKHADIREIMSDADLFHSADVNIMLYPSVGDEFLRKYNDGTTKVLDNLSYMDPPIHERYRTAIAQAFQPLNVRRFEERFREIARESVDRLLDLDGEADLVADLSRDYPLHAVMEMLGVPPQDYGLMLKLTQDTFGGDDPDWQRDEVPATPEAAARQWHASVLDFYEYFEEIRADRLAHPRDDLATSIVNARTADGELMPDRVQNHLTATVALAGHDTSNSAISGGMLGLIRHPEQLELVRADPSLIPGLVDESLRYATPAKHFMRNATRDTEFRGHRIRAMDRLMLLFVSGNRDADVFPDPYAFDVTRRPNPHLSFSYGPHVCLGQHIAKLEMRILFAELIPRIKTVELAGEPRLKIGNFVTGLKSLPIRFTKA